MRSESFTIKFPKVTKIIETDCHISKSYVTTPNQVIAKALWDTGATSSAITSEFAQKLGLKPIGKTYVNHADGTSLTNVYSVNVYLTDDIRFQFIQATEAILKDYDILIGMDIISHGDFSISNYDKKTTFSFRVPSIKEVDFSLEKS